jgi:flagellar basal-body rod modification protein FlgD
MEIAATGNVTSPYSVTTTRQTGDDQIAKADFLGLLVAQLKYQDPMEPMDNREFVTQLAQLQSLDLARQSNEALLALTYLSQLSQASSLIGRTVTATTLANGYVTGTVSEVRVVDGVASLIVDGTEVALHEITTVG